MKKRPQERFWEKVDKSGQCWIWKAGSYGNGYGAFSMTIRGVVCQYKAHRYAWEITFGEIPEGQCVCHKCDNPKCVNPSHLFLGTHRDNAKDRDQKGRNGNLKGHRNGNARLSEQDVIFMHLNKNLGAEFLGDKFKVKPMHVTRILNRERWPHVII